MNYEFLIMNCLGGVVERELAKHLALTSLTPLNPLTPKKKKRM